MLFSMSGVPAASRLIPPPEPCQMLSSILFPTIWAEPVQSTEIPPPDPPSEFERCELFLMMFPSISGDPHCTPIPPPPSVARLFWITLCLIVGDARST